MDTEEPEIGFRSEELHEMLSKPPSWMTRWGILVVCFFLIAVFIVSWLIKSPDILTGRLVLTTEEPPIKLYSRSNGTIQKLYLNDGAIVNAGDLIAEIENRIGIESVNYLKHNLPAIKQRLNSKQVIDIPLDLNLNLGEAQSDYNQLIKNYQDYNELMRSGYYSNSINNLAHKISIQENLLKIAEGQIEIFKKQLANAKAKNEIDNTLFNQNVISKIESIKEEDLFANKLMDYENLKKASLEYKLAIAENKRMLGDLKYEYSEKQRLYSQGIFEGIKNIENYISLWSKSFTLISPIRGKLNYLGPFTENQFINLNDELFAIVPEDEQYVAYAIVPSEGAGKIEIGQKVRLTFDNFPSQQYGKVLGKVKSISELPQKRDEFDQSDYRVTIKLDKGLITSYKKNIVFKPNMNGIAEIVTDELRFVERIFNRIRILFSAE